MLTLSKQFAVRIQCEKPFRNLKVSSSSEHLYLLTKRRRISEVSSTGKVRKLLSSRKESKILASGISECSTLIAGLLSTGQIVICSKQKKIFQSFLIPPQIKLSIEVIKPEQCFLHIFDKGLVLISPNDQIWLWKAEWNLKDPTNLSPHLKGIWINLNSSTLRVKSENSTFRSNISDSKPNSNSSRPVVVKSRFTTHGFCIKFTQDYVRGCEIGILRVWLRSINEDSCILETRYLTVNLIDQAKSGFESSNVSSTQEYTYKGQLDFWSKKGQKDMGLIAKLDNTNSIAAIGVNSSHPYFCQLVFLNPYTGICTSRKICNYATVDDIPVTASDGQTSFWIDDLVWAPNDIFVAVVFKSGFISIFNRLGDPVVCVLNMIKTGSEARIFSHTFFTTDPETVAKNGSFLSIDWNNSQLFICDGYNICELQVSNQPSIKDLIPLYMPNEVEQQDISINISHETNPIPSEMDSGPKRKNIEQAFHLLRCCLSISHSINSKDLIYTITSWIDNVLPPQLHEEINYTTVPNSRFETEARLSNNLILKKKMHAIDVYSQFYQIIQMENWSLVHNSDTKEWILSIAYQVFKYMLADQQALYAWNVLKLFERWIGFKLQRIRNMLVIYCLIQYRNHQANHINVVYFLLAFAAVRGSSNSSLINLSNEEEEFLRTFISRNIEMGQPVSLKAATCLNSFYYLSNKSKDKFDASLNYVLGYSNSFQDSYQEICCQLIKGNIKYADSYVNSDSLILFAYYFDPTEAFFISPIEVVSVFAQPLNTIYELLHNLKAISQIHVNKEKKFQKDSAFLYWSLLIYEKLEFLLQPDLAFYAINKQISVLPEEDATKAVKILKKIFEKENSLKFIELCHPSLKQLFMQHTINILRQKLMDFVITEKYFLNNNSNLVCESLYSIYKSEELGDIINTFKCVVGQFTVIKEKNEKWISLENSNFANNEVFVNKSLQEILKLLWYVRIQEQIKNNFDVEWRIRLISFQEIHNKNSVLELILSDEHNFSSETANIIALYIRDSIFPVSFTMSLRKWKERIQKTNESAHILHSLSQPAYVNPWIFDSDFLDFAEKIGNLKVSKNGSSESTIKSWNSSIKSMVKQYKVNGFLKYSNGSFIETAENEFFDISPFLSIFQEPFVNKAFEDKKNENLYISPIIMQKKRLSLEYSLKNSEKNSSFPFEAQISCKKIGNVLKTFLSKVFETVKQMNKPASRKKKQKENSFCFFSIKRQDSRNFAKIAKKNILLKFVNIAEPQPKSGKHRRFQSVLVNPIPSQKPFQLIRVKKSLA